MKKILLSLMALTVFFSLTSQNAFALRSDDAPDVIGPIVGEKLPVEIMMKDQTGTVKTLADLQGEKGTVLVFYRSADWCPYCQMQLIDLQLYADKPIRDKGYGLVGISYDDVSILKRFTKKWSIKYPLLSDEGSKVIDALNIRNPAYKGRSRFYGVPYPLVIVLDENGVVKAKLFEKSYRKRPPVSEILDAL